MENGRNIWILEFIFSTEMLLCWWKGRVSGDGRSWNCSKGFCPETAFLGDYRKCSTAGTKVPSYSVFETVYPIMTWI